MEIIDLDTVIWVACAAWTVACAAIILDALRRRDPWGVSIGLGGLVLVGVTFMR